MNAYHKRLVERMTHDLEDVLRSIADNPHKFIKAIAEKSTHDKLRQLVGDLRSLAEVIDDEIAS